MSTVNLQNKPARIIRSLRKFHGMTQSDFCTELNLTQGTLSKIEHGLLECSASLWFNITQFFEVDPLPAFQYGMTDYGHDAANPAPLQSKYRGKVSKSANRTTTIRHLRPLIKLLDDNNNINSLNDLGWDSDYFFVLDNTIDLSHYTDFILHLLDQKAFKKSQFIKLAGEFQLPSIHEGLKEGVRNENILIEHIKHAFLRYSRDWQMEWISKNKSTKILNLIGSDEIKKEKRFWSREVLDFNSCYYTELLRAIFQKITTFPLRSIAPNSSYSLTKDKLGLSFNLHLTVA